MDIDTKTPWTCTYLYKLLTPGITRVQLDRSESLERGT